jgi:excisionase family DNA binding protein
MLLPEIMTLKEVAKYLRVHPQTIYRLVKEGRLPAFKAGGDFRFHRADIERYVTYKYTLFGRIKVSSVFYRNDVLKKYLDNLKKYYIIDEAFSGRLGLNELYQKLKEGKISGKEEFVEIRYNKVRLNMAQPGEPHRWELVVVVPIKETQKIASIPEEQIHWIKYLLRITPPPQ